MRVRSSLYILYFVFAFRSIHLPSLSRFFILCFISNSSVQLPSLLSFVSPFSVQWSRFHDSSGSILLLKIPALCAMNPIPILDTRFPSRLHHSGPKIEPRTYVSPPQT
ncbi:hypothetical protein K438DRAFT_222936 [Mycena galopus ATCC 62051]|nr:hypothetical protein K438DRAFT_222936 [Mycena galopus ATCC 62051]